MGLRRRMGGKVIQVVALGIGLSALLLLTVIRADLLDTWRRTAPPDAPNRFGHHRPAFQEKEVAWLLCPRRPATAGR